MTKHDQSQLDDCCIGENFVDFAWNIFKAALSLLIIRNTIMYTANVP